MQVINEKILSTFYDERLIISFDTIEQANAMATFFRSKGYSKGVCEDRHVEHGLPSRYANNAKALVNENGRILRTGNSDLPRVHFDKIFDLDDEEIW